MGAHWRGASHPKDLQEQRRTPQHPQNTIPNHPKKSPEPTRQHLFIDPGVRGLVFGQGPRTRGAELEFLLMFIKIRHRTDFKPNGLPASYLWGPIEEELRIQKTSRSRGQDRDPPRFLPHCPQSDPEEIEESNKRRTPKHPQNTIPNHPKKITRTNQITPFCWSWC